MLKSTVVVGLALAAILSLLMPFQALAGSGKHKSSARLYGAPGGTGKAWYHQRKHGKKFDRKFHVQAPRGLPFQTIGVYVNGKYVGYMRANAVGKFKPLKMRSAPFRRGPKDGKALPKNFPKLKTGDIIEAGSRVGVFFDNTGGASNPDVFLLQGQAGPANVEYQEQPVNGQTDRRFTVVVAGVPAGQAFDIVINGQYIATLVTEATSQTAFELRTNAFINPGDSSLPMPNSFPSLQAGDLVQVGSFTVTLSPSSNSGGAAAGGSPGGGAGANGYGDDHDSHDHDSDDHDSHDHSGHGHGGHGHGGHGGHGGDDDNSH